MMKSARISILVLLGLVAQLSWAQAQGIAFITDVKGEATLGTVKAALMAELGKGARIVCARDCQVGVMYLVSGKEFTLKGPGDFVVGDLEVAAKIGAPPKVRDTEWKVSSQTVSQAVQTSNASIRMRSLGSAGTTAGGPDARTEAALAVQRLQYPVDTNVISLQPGFRWAADKVQGPFDFELKLTGANAKTIHRAKTTDARLKLPAGIKLQPDSAYAWTVKSGGREIGKATFKTVSLSSLELAQQRKPTDKAEFSDRLLYGLTLRELGASQDAAEVFGKLASERADSPELAALAK